MLATTLVGNCRTLVFPPPNRPPRPSLEKSDGEIFDFSPLERTEGHDGDLSPGFLFELSENIFY